MYEELLSRHRGEKLKAALYLALIAIGIACAQTMDYNEQVEMEAQEDAARAEYVAWHNEMMVATGDANEPAHK